MYSEGGGRRKGMHSKSCAFKVKRLSFILSCKVIQRAAYVSHRAENRVHIPPPPRSPTKISLKTRVETP